MNRHTRQVQAENVGFERRNLLEAVNLLRWIASRSAPDAVSDGLATTELAMFESLMRRAEQPFLEDHDHVVYGKIYGMRNEKFAVVYDVVPSVLDKSLETRNGRPATVWAQILICP